VLRILKERMVAHNKEQDDKEDEKVCKSLKSYETVKHSQFIVIVAVTEIEA
jgi:ribosome-binding ATPase YchF (GTP1/OBG family)